MEERIERYLIDEKGVESEIVRQKLREKVMKYDDIVAEFDEWLDERRYRKEGIKVAGYGASDIYKMAPMLDGVGVFNFLVTLRDEPEEAERIIESGFVVL